MPYYTSAPAARLGQETLRIERACVRSSMEYPLKQPFADSTMGPFQTFAVSSLELRDREGYAAEVFFPAAGRPVLESKLLPILFASEDRTYAEVYQDLYWAIRNDGFRSQSATWLGFLDMAVNALAARRSEMPLHRYWGADRDWASVYASGGGVNYDDDALRREMEGFLEKGFKVVKMKAGKNRGRDWEDDFRRVALVREILGPDVELAVDVNQVFSAEQAIAFARRLESYDIAWYEEPVHSADLEALQRVCADSPIPVSMGESEKSARVFSALIEAGIDHLQPVLGYQAAVEEWFEGAGRANEAGITFSSGGFSFSTCQGIAACRESAMTEYLYPVVGGCLEFLSRAPRIEAGKFHLDDQPGPAVTFNWEKARRDGLFEGEWVWTADTFSGYRPRVL